MHGGSALSAVTARLMQCGRDLLISDLATGWRFLFPCWDKRLIGCSRRLDFDKPLRLQDHPPREWLASEKLRPQVYEGAIILRQQIIHLEIDRLSEARTAP